MHSFVEIMLFILNILSSTQALFVPETLSMIDQSHQTIKINPAHNLNEAIKITDQIIDRLIQKASLPSLVFGISIRNKTLHKSAKGFIDVENLVPANITALYRIASITKSFTSLFIAKLIDSDKLSYEDSIYKYLPSKIFPPKYVNGKKMDITVGQTLSHMAGLHATNMSDFFNITFPSNSIESIKFRSNENLYFEPGTDWIYSNYGYQILGAIIETITGKTYQDAIDFFIKNDLKLSHGTKIERLTTILHNNLRPRYYRQNPEKIHENIPVGVFDDALFSTGIWAAGGIISNVDDLLAYGNRLLDAYHKRPNAIIKNETLTEIWTRRSYNAPHFTFRPVNEYGYGWFISHVPASINSNINHRDFKWHSGGLIGATTFLIVYPKEEIVAVAMTNKGSVTGLDILCIDAAELLYDFAPKE